MKLTKSQLLALSYHDQFDYPLTKSDLVRWQMGKSVIGRQPLSVGCRDGYYFLRGRQGIIKKRLLREKASEKKLEIAERAARVLRRIPTVKMLAVTGSLAMKNAAPEADIDLMIITEEGTLWLTRAIILVTLIILRVPTRRYADKQQKDKLCLNLWLDESDLDWRERNIFTAHEIAQIVPLVNKDQTYERFINSNRWLKAYWPKAIKIYGSKPKTQAANCVLRVLNLVTYIVQYFYMKKKMTKEVITSTRAIFHPNKLRLQDSNTPLTSNT